MLLRLCDQLIERRFTFGVDLGFVIHYVVHPDAPMLADFTVRDGALVEKLDNERP